MQKISGDTYCGSCHALYDGQIKREIDPSYRVPVKADNRYTGEKPTVIGARVYKRHRAIIKKVARKIGISEGEVVRHAIESFSL